MAIICKIKGNTVEFIERVKELTRKVEKQGEPMIEENIKEHFLISIELSYFEIIHKYNAAKKEIDLELKTFLINEENQE